MLEYDFKPEDIPGITLEELHVAGPEAQAAYIRAIRPTAERAFQRWGPGHCVWMNEAHEGAAGDRIYSTGFADCLGIIAVRGDRVLVVHDGQCGGTFGKRLEEFRAEKVLLYTLGRPTLITSNVCMIAYCSAKIGSGVCQAAVRFYEPARDMHGPPDLVYDDGRIWLQDVEFTWPEVEEEFPHTRLIEPMRRPADRIADFIEKRPDGFYFKSA